MRTGGGVKKSEESGMTQDLGATHRRRELPRPRWGTGQEQVLGVVGCRVAMLSARPP